MSYSNPVTFLATKSMSMELGEAFPHQIYNILVMDSDGSEDVSYSNHVTFSATKCMSMELRETFRHQIYNILVMDCGGKR